MTQTATEEHDAYHRTSPIRPDIGVTFDFTKNEMVEGCHVNVMK